MPVLRRCLHTNQPLEVYFKDEQTYSFWNNRKRLAGGNVS